MTTMPENMGYCFQVQRAKSATHINVFYKPTEEMFDGVEFVQYSEGDYFDLVCNK